jgi:hypothetical protein
MQPGKIIVSFAKEVRQLCQMCDDLPKVVEKLQMAIVQCILNGRMTQKCAQTVDIANVRREISAEGVTAEPSTIIESKKRKQSHERCPCKDEDVLETVVALNSGQMSMDRRKVFVEVMERGVHVLCWRHLRTFAGDAVGLFNSTITNDKLWDRLERLYNHRDQWESFTTENRPWFRTVFRVPFKANKLIPYAYRDSATNIQV